MPEAGLSKHMARCPDRDGAIATVNGGRETEASARVQQGNAATLTSRPRQPPPPAAPISKAPRVRVPHVNTRTTSTTLAHLSDGTFDSLCLHPPLRRAIEEVFHFERMTLVQQLAIPICLDAADRDVVAKARTGTGKTLGFLLPALHRVLSRPPPSGVASCPILVLSPTRELAMQTADEAKDLLTFVTPSKVMTVLGGTSMAKDVAAFGQGAPTVLVATPGRLDDHLHNTAGVRGMLETLCVLIMDEADQLLDRGFRPAIYKIMGMLPPPATRQTLLFSATFPGELQELTRSALRPSYEMVDCVGPGPQSNEQVEQQVTICTIDDLHVITAAILAAHVKQPEHKVMVFLQTAREAGFCAALFRQMNLGTSVFEIHSKKSQPQRSATSEQFRLCRSGILFSSDVSARGMDYPDVTFVLQLGNPPDRAQYLHRLGRTARAGREGAGLLLLCDYESYWLPQIGDLPVTQVPPPPLDEARASVTAALLKLHRDEPSVFMMAYRAWLGSNKGRLRELGWTTAELVRRANDMVTRVLLCPAVPPLDEKTIMSMGLRKVAGIVAAPAGVKLQQ